MAIGHMASAVAATWSQEMWALRVVGKDAIVALRRSHTHRGKVDPRVLSSAEEIIG